MIAYIAILTAILFIQEELLTFIPNVQFTFFLLVLYSKILKFRYVSLIVIIHVILDSLFMSSFNLIYMAPMFIGYLFIPIMINLFFKKIDNELVLASFGFVASIFYALCFAIITTLTTDVNFKLYIIADIPFTLILSFTSFLSILWLYRPLKKIFTEKFFVDYDSQV